jgi:hypothetical protein
MIRIPKLVLSIFYFILIHDKIIERMAKSEIQSMTRTISKENLKKNDIGVKKKMEKKIRAEKEFKIQNLIDETQPPWLSNEFDSFSLALTGKISSETFIFFIIIITFNFRNIL